MERNEGRVIKINVEGGGGEGAEGEGRRESIETGCKRLEDWCKSRGRRGKIRAT